MKTLGAKLFCRWKVQPTAIIGIIKYQKSQYLRYPNDLNSSNQWEYLYCIHMWSTFSFDTTASLDEVIIYLQLKLKGIQTQVPVD